MIEPGLLPYRSFGSVTVDTNALVVYTCPDKMRAQVTELLASDDASDARTLGISWTDQLTAAGGGPTTYTLAVAWPIAANTTAQQSFTRLALEAGDTLNVTGSAAGIHITVNVIEYSRFRGTTAP